MPKETVRDAAGSYDVRIGWTPEDTEVRGRLQLGVEIADCDDIPGRTLLWMLYGGVESQERIGASLHETGAVVVADYITDEARRTAFRENGARLLELIEGKEVTRLDRDFNPVGKVRDYAFHGVWSTLSLDGCDRVIRALRRARRAAFPDAPPLDLDVRDDDSRPSYAVEVEPGTDQIIRPERAAAVPHEVDYMRLNTVLDGVVPWLRTLGIQHIVHRDAYQDGTGRTPALTLYLGREARTVYWGEVLVLPERPTPAPEGRPYQRMQVLSASEFDARYLRVPRS